MLSPVVGRHGKLFSNIDRMSSLVRDFGPILSFLEVLFGESLSASLPDGCLFIRDYFWKWIVFDRILDTLDPCVSVFFSCSRHSEKLMINFVRNPRKSLKIYEIWADKIWCFNYLPVMMMIPLDHCPRTVCFTSLHDIRGLAVDFKRKIFVIFILKGANSDILKRNYSFRDVLSGVLKIVQTSIV